VTGWRAGAGGEPAGSSGSGAGSSGGAAVPVPLALVVALSADSVILGNGSVGASANAMDWGMKGAAAS
jgi:hypothetical protein